MLEHLVADDYIKRRIVEWDAITLHPPYERRGFFPQVRKIPSVEENIAPVCVYTAFAQLCDNLTGAASVI